MELTIEQKWYAEIIQKAWEDAEFKKELISNPVDTIEKFTGGKLELPEGKTLVIRDQTAEDTVYINIPGKQEVDAELNEEQLEAVSGGASFSISPIFGPPRSIGIIGIAPPIKHLPITPDPNVRFS